MNFSEILRITATMTREEFINAIEKIPTDIWGLKFFPSCHTFMSNDDEYPRIIVGEKIPAEISECNREVVRNVIKSFNGNLNAIMEIGVNRNDSKSLSQILINDKPLSCKYVGVDLDDKSYLNDANKNIFTLKSNSADQHYVRTVLSNYGINKLDILFIDGWHSVNMTVNDWMYADMLSEKGVVIIHDTNYHPGDVAILEAIDESLFDIQRFCLDNDMGISVARRK
jgi:hypothetical protein